jgi:hypothetical protein
LLTRTEEFDNAAWLGSAASASKVGEKYEIVSNAVGESRILQAYPAAPVNATVTFTIRAEKAQSEWLAVTGVVRTGGQRRAWFNLETGSFGTVDSAFSLQSSEEIFEGVYDIVLSLPVGSSLSAISAVYVGPADSDGDVNTEVGSSVFVYRAQAELGSTATPYQRVGSTFDVTEAGQPDNWYLAFDGVDDFMSTPSIDFTGTDKMSVFAGVRKLSDAQIAYIVATNGGLVGTMQLRAPGSSTADYRAVYRGNTATVASVAAGFAAPISNVVTAIADSSVPSVTIKVDAGTPSTSGADPGTGIFSAGQMLIGSVTSGAGFFNGQIFSILVRGALTDTDAIERTEKYVANRTAGVTL